MKMKTRNLNPTSSIGQKNALVKLVVTATIVIVVMVAVNVVDAAFLYQPLLGIFVHCESTMLADPRKADGNHGTSGESVGLNNGQRLVILDFNAKGCSLACFASILGNLE
jgi:hypothetical protein